MSPGPKSLKTLYRRSLIRFGQQTMIESVCTLCGFTIIGNVSGTLLQEEADHAKNCHGLASAPSSAA